METLDQHVATGSLNNCLVVKLSQLKGNKNSYISLI